MNCGAVSGDPSGRGGCTISVTFLLQSNLSLGLDVLQSRSQVPGQTACAVGCQQRAL